MVNIMRGRGRGKRGKVQDRLEVGHAGVKQGLDHRKGEFGVLRMGGSILGLESGRIMFAISKGIGTAKQSTMKTVRNKRTMRERARKWG